MAVKVLIVDDSPLTREMLADLLADEPDMQVVGMATNGAEAVALTRELNPDIISMDIRMPVMEGFEAIEIIMSENPCPILVVTDFDSTKTAFSAISKGALDVFPKKNIGSDNIGEYAAKLRMFSKVKVIRHMRPTPRRLAPSKLSATSLLDTTSPPLTVKGHGKYDIVAIASSTGGPGALVSVLSEFKAGFPVPVVVAQHMDDGFVHGFAEWLGSSISLKVKVGANGEFLAPCTVYLAPPEKHIQVSAAKRVVTIDRSPKDIYHPSCNLLLSSVGEVYADRSIGAILTGMGEDGVEGLGLIQRNKGKTIAQDEKSSIIFGMPGVAIARGYADRVLPLAEIGRAISQALLDPQDAKGSDK